MVTPELSVVRILTGTGAEWHAHATKRRKSGRSRIAAAVGAITDAGGQVIPIDPTEISSLAPMVDQACGALELVVGDAIFLMLSDRTCPTSIPASH